jgi:uncharacterized repeat protein (TIGR02543 family)
MGREILDRIRRILNRLKRGFGMIRFWEDMVKAGAGLNDEFKLMVGDPWDKGVKYIDLGDLMAYIRNSLEEFPVWTKTYWVAYDSDGGSDVAGSPFMLAEGDVHTIKGAPERDGYTFVQWECRYELATGPMIDYYNPGDTVGVYRNLTLWAIWVEEGTNVPQYIYFGYRMPGETSAIASDNCVVGESYTIIDFNSAWLPFGKVFTGWSYNGSTYQPGQSVVFPETPGVIYFTAVLVNAVPDSYRVSFLPGGINVSYMPDPDEYMVVAGTEYDIQSYSPSRLGYDFDGWLRDDTEELVGASFEMPANDVTLTAKWTPKLVDLYYEVNGEQEFWGDVNCGTMVTVRSDVPTKQGHVFAGWMDSEKDGLMMLLQPGEEFEMPYWMVVLVAQFNRDPNAIGFVEGDVLRVRADGSKKEI